MLQTDTRCDVEACRELVDRVLASRVMCKSARLRELLSYLADKVLRENVSDVHEIELGHHVFGRPRSYDTAADNIVRVHASQLRKRLADYFRNEGRHEELIIEIPRGNYAPIFRARTAEPDFTGATAPEAVEVASQWKPEAVPPTPAESALPPRMQLARTSLMPGGYSTWLWVTALVALIMVSVFLGTRLHTRAPSTRTDSLASSESATPLAPLWSHIFQPKATTQLVLDDASLDLYQQVMGHPIPLSEYFDRSYVSTVESSPAGTRLGPHLVHSLLLRRRSNFASANLVARFVGISTQAHGSIAVQFARDFSFRQLKSSDVILVGTPASNPWMQPFSDSMSVHWQYDPDQDAYYPVDITAGPSAAHQYDPPAATGVQRESYATVDFLPNLGGTGDVLVLAGTGGTAIGAALTFLSEPASVARLAAKLPPAHSAFPYFEALLQVDKGGAGPRSVRILLCRSPRDLAVKAH